MYGVQASVSYYAENELDEFIIGRDGYVSGINWFVFYLDGATGEIKPCDRTNCPGEHGRLRF